MKDYDGVPPSLKLHSTPSDWCRFGVVGVFSLRYFPSIKEGGVGVRNWREDVKDIRRGRRNLLHKDSRLDFLSVLRVDASGGIRFTEDVVVRISRK